MLMTHCCVLKTMVNREKTIAMPSPRSRLNTRALNSVTTHTTCSLSGKHTQETPLDERPTWNWILGQLCKDEIGPYQVQAVCIPKFRDIFDLCKNPLQIHYNNDSQNCLKHTNALYKTTLLCYIHIKYSLLLKMV